MAITDTYATVDDYKLIAGNKNSDKDLIIDLSLQSASRFIERICRRTFNVDSVPTTRYYDGKYSTRFVLYDDISSTTGLIVTVDNDNNHIPETALTLNTHYFVEYNTMGGETEPIKWLQLIPSNGLLETWPSHIHSLAITAYFGWAAVPAPIKSATIIIARQILDLSESGVLQSLNLVDAALPIQRRTANLVDLLIDQYKRRASLVI